MASSASEPTTWRRSSIRSSAARGCSWISATCGPRGNVIGSRLVMITAASERPSSTIDEITARLSSSNQWRSSATSSVPPSPEHDSTNCRAAPPTSSRRRRASDSSGAYPVDGSRPISAASRGMECFGRPWRWAVAFRSLRRSSGEVRRPMPHRSSMSFLNGQRPTCSWSGEPPSTTSTPPSPRACSHRAVTSRDLPMPGSPEIVTQPPGGLPSDRALRHAYSSSACSWWRPTRGRSAPMEAPLRSAVTVNVTMGASTPFTWRGGCSSNSNLPRSRRWTSSEMMSVPGSASDSRRAATLTANPYSSADRRSRKTSPLWTATRTPSRACPSVTSTSDRCSMASMRSRPARTARSTSFSWATGKPNDARMPSPRNDMMAPSYWSSTTARHASW